MKRYSAIAAAAAAVFAIGAFSGCGLKKSEESQEQETAAVIETPSTPEIEETDFMAFILDGGDTNYLHMTIDELNAATGDSYIEENSIDYDMSMDYATYSYGELDSLFCGRVKFDDKLPVECTLSFRDGKIVCITYSIEKGDTEVDPKSVSDSIAACLAEKLPEDYNAEYDRQPEGKDSAVFANTVDGYVFTVKHFDLDGSGFPVKFSLETYKDKYRQ